MAENYDAAIRRRLSTIDQMGQSATGFARQRAETVRRPALGDSIRQPGFPSGGENSLRQPGGRANNAALIAFGKQLQKMGYRVAEHSAFNNGRRITSGHSRNSRHYRDRAIDVNWSGGTSRAEQQKLAAIIALSKQYGLNNIFMKPGHYGHAHFDY